MTLIQLKALTQFALFGFVNLLYEPNARPVLSATMTLLHRPLFFSLMALDLGLGCTLFAAIARRMRGGGDGTPGKANEGQSPELFLWDFVALFALLYLASPSNALGVISIDMRLAQLALVPSLFLFAKRALALCAT